MRKLDKRIAIVTGGGRGIGRAVCRKLAGEGAWVVVNDLTEEAANSVVEDIRSAGGVAISCAGSVTDDDFPSRLVSAALDAFGDIHIIVNNAGYSWDSKIHRMTDEQFDSIIDVHLKAPFRILRAASSHILEKAKGEAATGAIEHRKIVNVSSISGVGGLAGQVNYSSAKAGIIGMTKALAKEWGPLAVNVNAVAFGMIETRMTASVDVKQTVEIDGHAIKLGMPPAAVDAMKAAIPLGRPGTVEEAAGAIYLLCSPESNYVTGQVLSVDGGIAI